MSPFAWRVVTPLLLAALCLFALLTNPGRVASAALVVVSYILACVSVYLHHRRPNTAIETGVLTLAYASQSGQAQRLAQLSADQLTAAGVAVQITPLNRLPARALHGQVLFILSTYGEGEAPDNGAHFLPSLRSAADLSVLRYAVLALGDRSYAQFCAFGLQVDEALRARHAQQLSPPLTVDQLDPASLAQWQQQLAHLSGVFDFQPWQRESLSTMTLTAREHLNSHSPAEAVYELSLTGPTLPHWQAGDLLDVQPQHARETLHTHLKALGFEPLHTLEDGRTLIDALATRQLPDEQHRALPPSALLEQLSILPLRTYSIASTPRDDALQLLVRQMRHPDGRLGLGSGWLCQYAPVAAELAVRVRANPSFHGPRDEVPMILIGSGTGLAGLRAHLRARPVGTRNWLVFGERHLADWLCRDELLAWQASGHLTRLDLAFSREQAQKVYVQDVLRDAADELREWINQGAAVYLCGSLQGMGRDVHALLSGLLGEAQLAQLQAQGRYRRDLY